MEKFGIKQFIAPAAILSLGVIVAAAILSGAAERFTAQNRYVSVKGLSEREFPADRVVWPILFKEVGNDLMQLSKSSESKRAIITKFLIDNGIKESEISISAPEIIDLQADRYSSNNIIYRYNMTNVLTVASNNVDKVRELLSRQGDLLKQGVVLSAGDYRYNVMYQYTKLNEVKVEMIKEASANARASAQQFADDSQSELGKIKTATQGQVSISDRDPNTPHIKNVRVITSVSYFLND
ncbi:MAG: SIMPL domain-containing protein [Rikenellaceae bacterium]